MIIWLVQWFLNRGRTPEEGLCLHAGEAKKHEKSHGIFYKDKQPHQPLKKQIASEKRLLVLCYFKFLYFKLK